MPSRRLLGAHQGSMQPSDYSKHRMAQQQRKDEAHARLAASLGIKNVVRSSDSAQPNRPARIAEEPNAPPPLVTSACSTGVAPVNAHASAADVSGQRSSGWSLGGSTEEGHVGVAAPAQFGKSVGGGGGRGSGGVLPCSSPVPAPPALNTDAATAVLCQPNISLSAHAPSIQLLQGSQPSVLLAASSNIPPPMQRTVWHPNHYAIGPLLYEGYASKVYKVSPVMLCMLSLG